MAYLSRVASPALPVPRLSAQADVTPTPVLLALVLAAIAFNLFLCFVNTHIAGVGSLHVMASEVLIVSLVFLASYRSIREIHLILLGGIALWVLSLASIRVAVGTDSGIDVKIVRDLAIPLAFFLLGTRARDVRTADRVVFVAAAIVLAVALFEYFWLETFLRVFNVAKYYIARGTMGARDALQSADLFISGMRPAGAEGGRNLLPFLGDHRVSSVFLEPVSLGNFGAIVVIWGLVRWRFGRSLQLATLAAGLSLVVLADSRFGAYLCALALFLTFLPTRLVTMGALSIPVVAIAVLALVPALVTGSYDPQNRYVDNGFVGRFVLSAQILSEFDFLTWMGLKALRMQAFDSGYAYIIGGIGIVGLLAVWGLFFAIKGGSEQFYMFRNLAAIYYGTVLCVSNSPFTIKTASLLWFLIGALAIKRVIAHPNSSAVPLSPRRAHRRSGIR